LLIVPDSAGIAEYQEVPRWDSNLANDLVMGRRSKNLEQKFDELKRQLRIGALR
jgi:hypothetical protein